MTAVLSIPRIWELLKRFKEAGDDVQATVNLFGTVDLPKFERKTEYLALTKNGTYPVVRPLYFLTKTQPTGIVKDFIDFCTGPDGQKIVAEEGYITID